MTNKTFCPHCGSESIEVWGTDRYECKECGEYFDYDNMEHEDLRQRISSVCSALFATEENPINCVREDVMELHIEDNGGGEVAQGLSEFEKPQVESIFQDNEGLYGLSSMAM